MSEDAYWLGFSAFPGVGPKRFHKILEVFGTAQNAWQADEEKLNEILGNSLNAKFTVFKKTFNIERYSESLEHKKISYFLLKNPDYPQLLKQSFSPPFVLYIKGDKQLVSKNTSMIAVVGTRKITQYGKHVTAQLTQELVHAGCVIVSGLALGVDSCAHQSTIATYGKTIAVLGCGVDCCSPSENLTIYDKIVEQFGAIVSESAFGGVTSKGVFPSRNRIIAGLSQGVVVTEGAEDSGALITAKHALENKRPVFAVPGPITSTLSKGPIYLIQQGAIVITSADDILSALKIVYRKQRTDSKVRGTTDMENMILTLLENETLQFDEIVRKIGIDATQAGGVISMMEIKGLIKNIGGGKFGL